MGQLITVTAMSLGETAVFSLDRSLTGQDGVGFAIRPADTSTPPALLAGRLFDSDPGIGSVHVLSNMVTVTRTDGWSDQGLEQARTIIANLFIFYAEATPEAKAQSLRDQHYNSTITHIREHNPELWIIRVRHDEPIDPYKGGQYTTLGLGYWEPRADDATEDFDADPDLITKMARRSYSVSSSIIDGEGNLKPAHPDDVEFYVVQVRPNSGPDLPGLTPRLFTRKVGDRIYMGRKFTGRYTLDNVDPTDNIVFLSTGTGEAPQNAMVAELLRNNHQGRILSVVCVRFHSDLAYIEEQRKVEEQYPNYQYLVLTTREPENEGRKVYIQDLLLSGEIETALGEPIDPANTHVFLCGNPSMIGIPEWDEDDNIIFPDVVGVCQILHERGFTIDRHKHPGNVHYEEYW